MENRGTDGTFRKNGGHPGQASDFSQASDNQGCPPSFLHPVFVTHALPHRYHDLLPSIAKRTAFFIGAAAVLAYFIWFAGPGVRAGFSFDDLMNMHSALVSGTFRHHLTRSLLFFLPSTRPLGAALYRLAYHYADLNPGLLHAMCFSVALFNLSLLFIVAAKISGSREIGLFAALLGAFHGNYYPLYYNAGMCYDLLSFSFFYLAIWFYISIRQKLRVPRPWENALILLCFIFAIAAKEIALSLPLVLIVYELMWDPPKTLRASMRWFFNRGRTALLCAAIAIVFVAVKVYGPSGLANTEAYQPTFSLNTYLTALTTLMDDLVYRGGAFTPYGTVSFWCLLIAIAALLRSRLMIFCVALVLIGILPIAFIPARGLASAYVPCVGFWMYLAALLVFARRFITASLGNSDAVAIATQAVLFCSSLLVLAHFASRNFDPKWVTTEQKEIGHVIQSLRDMHLQLPKGANVLIVKDPLAQPHPFSTFFILRLLFRDPTLELHQCSEGRPRLPHYDAIVTYEDDRFRSASNPSCVGS